MAKKKSTDIGASEPDVSAPWAIDEPAFVPEGPGLFGAPQTVGETLATADPATPYVVLARKYRPQSFPDLIGQDAMVTTLRNAFASGRIAQGYMLTGVRGVGKTTTARILARGLNYEIEGQAGGPTVDMPVLGRHCADIIASRHPDVVEMDAASNTGIENIREIIESARYKPIVARTKVFIIDEVHMLSKSAFNGLLKTLEEPPAHVKFIFATTEIRKVPVTVLSRCQRFDLRRVEVPVLAAHFKSIVAKEGARADDEALALIARAAGGSVRDGLSILDQAIALSLGAKGAGVTALQVREMLGLADRGRIFDLLEKVVAGDIASALAQLTTLNRDGAEPPQVLADLAEAVHQTSRIKVMGSGAASEVLSGPERTRAEALAAQLSVPLLSRLWQMLLKGLEEASASRDPLAAVEMVLIRIAHTADLPSPEELVRIIGGDPSQLRSVPARQPASPAPSAPLNALPTAPVTSPAPPDPDYGDIPDDDTYELGLEGDVESPPDEIPSQAAPISIPGRDTVTSFADILELAGRYRDAKLKIELEDSVSLVRFDAAAGTMDLFLMPGAPASLPSDLIDKLNRWTGRKWVVALSRQAGEPTVGALRREREIRERAILEQHPAVLAVLEAFPNSKITAIKTPRVVPDDTDESATG